MKTIIRTILLVVLLLVSVQWVGAGYLPEFINGDFEYGNLSGWDVTQKGNGNASVLIPGGESSYVCCLTATGPVLVMEEPYAWNYTGISQTLDTRAAINISFQYKIVETGGEGDFYYGYSFPEGECGQSYFLNISETTDWITVNASLESDFPGSCNYYNENLLFYINCHPGDDTSTLTVYIDNVTLLYPTDPYPPGPDPGEDNKHLYWKLVTDDIDQQFYPDLSYETGALYGTFFEWQDYLHLLTYPNGKLYRSSNGNTWTLINNWVDPFNTSVLESGQRRIFPAIGSDGSYMYVIGGIVDGRYQIEPTDVWRSDDGIVWNLVCDDAWAEYPPFGEYDDFYRPAIVSMVNHITYEEGPLLAIGVGGSDVQPFHQSFQPVSFYSFDYGESWHLLSYPSFALSDFPSAFYDQESDAVYILNGYFNMLLNDPPDNYMGHAPIIFKQYPPAINYYVAMNYSANPLYEGLNGSTTPTVTGVQHILEWDDKMWLFSGREGVYSGNNYSVCYADRDYYEYPGYVQSRAFFPYYPRDSSHPEMIYSYYGENPDGGEIWVAGYFPQAAFSGTPTSGSAPLNVTFTDESENEPTYWYWQFGDGTVSLEQNPTHTYTSSGTYTVQLYVSNEYGTDIETKTDYITVDLVENVALWGHVIDAVTNATIPLATVSMKQGAMWHNTTANATGGYSFPDEFYTGLSIYSTTNTTGYTPWPTLFTIWWPGTYEIDLYAIPEFDINETADAWIGGFVYDEFLAQGIPGATVNIWNGTWSDTNITNGAGFWYFTNLTNTTYNFNATAASYDNSLEYNATGVWGNFTQLDIPLSPNYEADITFRNEDTLALIYDTITVVLTNTTTSSILSTMNTTNSTWSSGLLDYGLYNITASCEGYYPAEATIYLYENVTGTIYLDPIEEFDGVNTNYVPRPVRFTYVDAYGNPITGATVTATVLESSNPWSWLEGIFGFSSTVDIQGTVLSGTTGSDGTLSFMMIETIQYRVNCVKASAGIDHTVDIYPKNTEYFIRIGSLPMVGSYPTYSLNATTVGTNVVLFGNYTDTSGSSSSVRFIVRNSTGSEVYNTSVTLTGGVGSAYYAVNNTRGDQYTFGITAEHTTQGHIEKWIDITLKGAGRLVDFGSGWTDFMYLAMSLAGIFLVAGCFGEIDVRLGAIFIPITAGIFWFIGWMGETYGLLIMTAGVLGVLYYMRSKAKELDT